MTISANTFAKKVFTKSVDFGWTGANLTGGAYGFDDLFSGEAYGDPAFEFGGIDHFRARIETVVSH